MSDPINPQHYKRHASGVECIDIVEHMSFNLGNAVKYLWRAYDKGDPLENLQKAAWYVSRELSAGRQHARAARCPETLGKLFAQVVASDTDARRARAMVAIFQAHWLPDEGPPHTHADYVMFYRDPLLLAALDEIAQARHELETGR